jgi:hypothetical protein
MSEAMQRYDAQRAPIYDGVSTKRERQAELHALAASIATHARLHLGGHLWEFRYRLAA